MGTVENSKKGVLVYPAFSRRSGGLSVGINLFPDKKRCSFDCPYCEVFPFSGEAVFSAKQMEDDLKTSVASFLAKGIIVKDICFSGNGEPTMSKHFPEALERAAKVRFNLLADAKLVLITNGSGLFDDKLFALLADNACITPGLDIWLKLDAGTPEWYEKMSRCDIPFEKLTEKIKAFAAVAPVTIQTMICAFDGKAPTPEEGEAWEKLVLELASGGNLRLVQIYGKARPSPEDPLNTALPVTFLEERAASLRRALADSLITYTAPNVEVYP